MNNSSSLLAFASGIAAHLLIFIRGEWHVRSPWVLRSYLLGAAVLAIFHHTKLSQDVSQALGSTAWLVACHVTALFGSMLLYRGAFHPLRGFPGPFLARFSKLWHVWHCRSSQNHLFLDALREKYGNFVRTGPNEITIFHPDGLAAINRTDDSMRSGWYDLVHPSFSINTVRDQGLHDQRRKVWEPAFTAEAMRDYERRIRKYALKAESLIPPSNQTPNPIDMNALIYRFAYDVMSDLAFGTSTDKSSNDTEWQRSVRTMHTGLSILGPLSPAPWIALLAFSFKWIPLVRDWDAMMAFCSSKMAARVASLLTPDTSGRDIAAWLIADAKRRGTLGTPEEKRWLDGDGFSVILAGSDTTASTLVFAFWYLARRPQYQTRILAELKAMGAGEGEDWGLESLTFRDFERLPFLNALINETLRLHHPLPTAGARIVRNPKGMSVGGQHIPTGANLVAPRWSYGRCEEHYTHARDFIPERWLAGNEPFREGEDAPVLDRRAFTPWAGGKWACLGKPVALLEARYLISLLVNAYEIELPDGDNGEAVERDYKDQVTAYPGKLRLVFKPRI